MSSAISDDFLIDTNVLSELARKRSDAGVEIFLANTPRILVSTMLFHELSFGVETAAQEKKIQLTSFLAAMRGRFGARAIPVTMEIAETAGQLRAYEKNKGRVLTVTDCNYGRDCNGEWSSAGDAECEGFCRTGVAGGESVCSKIIPVEALCYLSSATVYNLIKEIDLTFEINIETCIAQFPSRHPSHDTPVDVHL